MDDENGLMDVAYWLAVEDYLMTGPPAAKCERYFILWRASPCVAFGRNQILEAEVDLREAKARNIGLARRTSGGGAVYIDAGAIQYAMIQPFRPGFDDARLIGQEQIAGYAARALNAFGVPAVVEGRNDILANGCKISGISQFVRRSRICAHGTLLYDTDLGAMSGLLKPGAEKFRSKAVQSVRSRVANVKPMIARPDYMGGKYRLDTVEGFARAFDERIRADAASRGQTLPDFAPDGAELDEIHKIRREVYANPDHIYRASPPYTFHTQRKFPQGIVGAYVDVRDGAVASCALRGDFIGSAPVEAIESALRGMPFQRDAFDGALDEAAVRECLGGVGKAELLDMIFG